MTNLLEGIEVSKTFGSVEVSMASITNDSRKVKRGSLFVAVKGLTVDGHEFVEEAIEKGVVAVVGEKKPRKEWLEKCTYIQVKDSRKALAFLASAWHGNPAKQLKVIGVTGTDGKTTTASIIHHILVSAGKKAGLITSVSAKIGKKEFDTGLHVTNPEPLELHEFLAEMVKEQCEYAVLEVTSHGLQQERVCGISFDIGVLTNITHEHTDYHGSWEAYRDAKLKLFNNADVLILNKDDKSFSFIKNNIGKKRTISYGLHHADLFASDIKSVKSGQDFKISYKDKTFQIKTKLLGIYNVENILAASVVALNLGISPTSIAKAIKTFRGIKGRLEEVNNSKGFNIYIDFAHTPNSLRRVLALLNKRKKKGKLICVFGCASERDVEKREMMGEVSGRLADVSILTAEDPRSEDVNNIIDLMEKGAKSASSSKLDLQDYRKLVHGNKKRYYLRIPERGEAIAFAILKLARKDDLVVICGKGHEQSMNYSGVEHPWSDRQAVVNVLKSNNNLTAILLAAGKGTRMNGSFPKVLRKIAGRPLVSYTLDNLRSVGFGKIVMVVGYKSKEVINSMGHAVDYAHQEKMLGTGDALAKGLKVIDDNGSVVVLNGDDSAFYSPDKVKEIIRRHVESSAIISFVSLIKDDPTGLGRVIRDTRGKLVGIVEENDTDEKQKQIKEVNDGLYVFDLKWLRKNVARVKKSASGEYYIVDLIKIALSQKRKVLVHKLEDSGMWQGVNTKEQLEVADKKMREKIENYWKDHL